MVKGPPLGEIEGEVAVEPRLKRAAQRAIGAMLLLAAAACSTTDYSKPVNDFAAATDNAEKALAELSTQVTDAYQGVLEGGILSRRTFLQFSQDECLVASPRCRLAVIDPDSGAREFYPPEPPLIQMTLLMSQINRYASNLKALLEADSASQVETQVNAALGSVQNLAETVPEARAKQGVAPADIPPFATPVGAGVNWIVGQYVEGVKYKGLQRATAAAKPVVREAADLFATVSAFVSDVPRKDLANDVSKTLDAFRDNGDAANLAKLRQSAAKFDALLTSTPPDLFKRLGDAHDALADALQGGEVSIATAIGKIEAFAAEAETLAKILKDIRAIVPDNG